MEEARQRHGEASLSLPFPSFPHPDAVIGSSPFYLLTFEGKEKGRKLCNGNNHCCDPFHEQGLQGPQQCASEQGVFCSEEIEECTCTGRNQEVGTVLVEIGRDGEAVLVQGCREGQQGGVDVPADQEGQVNTAYSERTFLD